MQVNFSEGVDFARIMRYVGTVIRVVTCYDENSGAYQLMQNGADMLAKPNAQASHLVVQLADLTLAKLSFEHRVIIVNGSVTQGYADATQTRVGDKVMIFPHPSQVDVRYWQPYDEHVQLNADLMVRFDGNSDFVPYIVYLRDGQMVTVGVRRDQVNILSIKPSQVSHIMMAPGGYKLYGITMPLYQTLVFVTGKVWEMYVEQAKIIVDEMRAQIK